MNDPQQIIRNFFARHHAVPATDAGPDFGAANDDALLGWARGGDVKALEECSRRLRQLLVSGAHSDAEYCRVGKFSVTLARAGYRASK